MPNWGGPCARGQWAGGLRAAARPLRVEVPAGCGLTESSRSCAHGLQSHPSWSLKVYGIESQAIYETLRLVGAFEFSFCPCAFGPIDDYTKLACFFFLTSLPAMLRANLPVQNVDITEQGDSLLFEFRKF